jgi:hypothetical protein
MNPTGRVGEKKGPDTEPMGRADTGSHFVPGMAFIVMKPAVEKENAPAGPTTQQQPPGVTRR